MLVCAALVAGRLAVVVAGLGMEKGAGLAIAFGALLAAQIGALGAALAADGKGGAGPLWSTLAFYAGTATAFLALHGAASGVLNWSEGLVVGTLVLVSAILVWREGLETNRFRETSSAGRGAVLRGLLGPAALCALMGLALWKPLPWAGERVVEMGVGAREYGQGLMAKWKGEDEADGKGETTADGSGDGVELDFGRRRELPQQADLVLGGESLVHVRIDDRAEFEQFVSRRHYLRSWVLERYTGDGWDEPPSDSAFIADAADGESDGWVTLQAGEGIAHRVYLPDAGGAGLPAIHNPLRYQLSFLLESAPDMFEAELRGAVFYDVVSAPQRFADFDPGEIRPGVIGREHLFAGGEERVATLASNLFGGQRGGGAQLAAVKQFLTTNCRYAMRVENPDGRPALENFLFGERVGWCDFFATAAVLLAREAGFPARMAYGFSGGQAFRDQQVISYRESDAHAWAEVFVAGKGWVVFDATPAGEGAARPPERGQGAEPELAAYRAAENEDLSGAKEASRRGGIPNWVAIAVAIVAGLGVLLIAWRLYSRREERDDDGGGKDDQRVDSSLPPYLREFFRLCLEAGQPKAKGDTLRETVETLYEVGLGTALLDGVASYYYAVRYESADRDRRTEGELRRELKRMRKAL